MENQKQSSSATGKSPLISSESSTSQSTESDGLVFTSFTESESNDDDLEPLPLGHVTNPNDLNEDVFGMIYEKVPDHAIELRAYSGNNPLGATKIYRYLRGARRTLNDADLYQNVYEPLIQVFSRFGEECPKTPDELCFVQKIKEEEIPVYVSNNILVYSHGKCFYIKIPNEQRDAFVKKNIGQKRKASSNTAENIDASPSAYLNHFLMEKRNILNTLEDANLYTENFEKLMICADKAVEQDLNDFVMILDVQDVVVKHWDALLRKRRNNPNDEPRDPFLPPDSDEDTDPDRDRKRGPSKRQYNPNITGRTGISGSAQQQHFVGGSGGGDNLSAMMQQLSILEEGSKDDDMSNASSAESSQESRSGDGNASVSSSSSDDDDDAPPKDAPKRQNTPTDAASCAQAAREGDLEALQLAFKQGTMHWDTWICAFAAEQGHIEVLEWARSIGFPWDEWTCCLAAENGHLKVLQWARSKGCPWDELTCSSAAKNGHLEILQWARAQGCRWDADCTARAAENGHLDVLIWARTNGCPWNVSTCENAAKKGHFEVLQWAHQNGCPWDKWTCAHAASIGRLDILQWARENYCPWDASTCANAAKSGHLHILKWARANGCAWDARTYTLAAEHRHLHVLQWARANGCPRESDVAVGIVEEEDTKLPASITSADFKDPNPTGSSRTVDTTVVTGSSWTVATGSVTRRVDLDDARSLLHVDPPSQQPPTEPADSSSASSKKGRFFGFARRWRNKNS